MGERVKGCEGQRARPCLVLEQLAGHVGAAQRQLGFLTLDLADEGFDHPVLVRSSLGEEKGPGWRPPEDLEA